MAKREPKQPKTTTTTLEKRWAAYRAVLGRVNPQAAASFRAPASVAARRKLAERLGRTGPLPEAIEAWFSWHDGLALEGLGDKGIVRNEVAVNAYAGGDQAIGVVQLAAGDAVSCRADQTSGTDQSLYIASSDGNAFSATRLY